MEDLYPSIPPHLQYADAKFASLFKTSCKHKIPIILPSNYFFLDSPDPDKYPYSRPPLNRLPKSKQKSETTTEPSDSRSAKREKSDVARFINKKRGDGEMDESDDGGVVPTESRLSDYSPEEPAKSPVKPRGNNNKGKLKKQKKPAQKEIIYDCIVVKKPPLTQTAARFQTSALNKVTPQSIEQPNSHKTSNLTNGSTSEVESYNSPDPVPKTVPSQGPSSQGGSNSKSQFSPAMTLAMRRLSRYVDPTVPRPYSIHGTPLMEQLLEFTTPKTTSPTRSMRRASLSHRKSLSRRPLSPTFRYALTHRTPSKAVTKSHNRSLRKTTPEASIMDAPIRDGSVSITPPPPPRRTPPSPVGLENGQQAYISPTSPQHDVQEDHMDVDDHNVASTSEVERDVDINIRDATPADEYDISPNEVTALLDGTASPVSRDVSPIDQVMTPPEEDEGVASSSTFIKDESSSSLPHSTTRGLTSNKISRTRVKDRRSLRSKLWFDDSLISAQQNSGVSRWKDPSRVKQSRFSGPSPYPGMAQHQTGSARGSMWSQSRIKNSKRVDKAEAAEKNRGQW